MLHATADIGTSNYTVSLVAGHHALVSDEGAPAGGQDAGPTPHELVCAALGACTAITLRMYAQRKKWPLHAVHVLGVDADRGRGAYDDPAVAPHGRAR